MEPTNKPLPTETAVPSGALLDVSVYDGKYRVRQESSGHVHALRYDEKWRDCCGDGLILALAQEVQRLRDELKSNKVI